jgi:NAD(P)-dependent dehydrogenase (short-subunit alcohol dehydrogenase family)
VVTEPQTAPTMSGNAVRPTRPAAALHPQPVVDVQGQYHIVVGAASGIGRAISRRLASLGASVACLDLDSDGAALTVEQIVAANGRAQPHQVDLRDHASVTRAVDAAVTSLGGLHGVINCVGTTGPTGVKTHQVEPEDFEAVCRVNLFGAFLLSRCVLPRMIANGYGRMLHLASISGKEGNEGMAAYSASKAGLIGLVKVLGKEYAETGVTINALAPAVIQTPMVDALPPRQVSYMTDRIPMRRPGTLDEVANLAAWVVSPSCSFVTGFTFDMSGGRAVY